ncbi:MAG: DEAD/DEAH box helicase [Candidatus Omnitrophota bacterium]
MDMSILDSLKGILGVKPVNIGRLNRHAAGSFCQSKDLKKDNLDILADIEVTEEYENIEKLLNNNLPILFVSGKAGTGKTTLIHYLREKLNKNVVVVAPTGVAALNAKGATIHSFFRLPPRIITNEDIKGVRSRTVYEKIDVLIVDEVSMVRADLIDAMDQFLRLNGPRSNQPFGGIQVLFVGDLFQLPPVVKKQEEKILAARRYESPFFFSAKVLQNCEFVPIELCKIFRQTDSKFTEMLNRIRVAEQCCAVIHQINKRCIDEKDEAPSLITLTCTNTAADKINNLKLQQLPGEVSSFIGEISGKFAVQEEKLPSPLNLQLKPGAQVMFTKNDEQKRWVNGTIGRVVNFKNELIQVELVSDQSREVLDVHRVSWESFKYAYDYSKDKIKPVVVGKYTQFPLMLAWAVTIHKSQGKTLEKVRVDLGNGAFASGQVYVALSRCRSLRDITLARPIEKNEIKCDQRIKRFYEAIIQV